MAAVAAADDLIATSLSLHETLEGPAQSADAKRPLAEGPGSFHTVLATDIMSMVSALTASAMRVPREKGLTIHMFWMKEQLLRALITTLQWLDTRDISCDGHTKGTVDRTMLKDLQRGHWKPHHPTNEYQLGQRGNDGDASRPPATVDAETTATSWRGTCTD